MSMSAEIARNDLLDDAGLASVLIPLSYFCTLYRENILRTM
jgi:hypothetical protein